MESLIIHLANSLETDSPNTGPDIQLSPLLSRDEIIVHLENQKSWWLNPDAKSRFSEEVILERLTDYDEQIEFFRNPPDPAARTMSDEALNARYNGVSASDYDVLENDKTGRAST